MKKSPKRPIRYLTYICLFLVPPVVLNCQNNPQSNGAVFGRELRIGAAREVFLDGRQTPYAASKWSTHGQGVYLETFHHGLFRWDGAQFSPLGIQPEGALTGEKRFFSAFWAPAKSGGDVDFLAASKTRLYRLVSDSGEVVPEGKGAWLPVPQDGIRPGTRFSSLTRCQGVIYCGTTFNGVYRFNSKTLTWTPDRDGLPREIYSWNEYFYDEIQDLFTVSNRLLARTWPGGRIYSRNQEPGGMGWTEIPIPEPILQVAIDHSVPDATLIGEKRLYRLEFHGPGNTATWIPNQKTSSEARFTKDTAPEMAPLRQERFDRRRQSRPELENVHSVFVNLDFVTEEQVTSICRSLEKGLVNGVVVNFKDDTGNMIWGPSLPGAKAAGAAMVHFKLKWFLGKILPYKPHLVARMVMFKDYRLHSYDKGRLAPWDPVKMAPWRANDMEFWVDPFSSEVLKYQTDAIRELASRREEFGLSEIQLDYVRLPSDPSSVQAQFRHRRPQDERGDPVERLLASISDLPIALSVDFYGYKGFYRMGGVIGQDTETASEFVDVVCPMVYPSHFGDSFLKDGPDAREKRLIRVGTQKSLQMVWKGALVRPWLQAFNHRSPGYGPEYLRNQVFGSVEGGSKTWSLWHPIGDYLILDGIGTREFGF